MRRAGRGEGVPPPPPPPFKRCPTPDPLCTHWPNFPAIHKHISLPVFQAHTPFPKRMPAHSLPFQHNTTTGTWT